jgi:hypothetical protein
MKKGMLTEYVFVGGSYDGETLSIDQGLDSYLLPPKNMKPVIMRKKVPLRPEPLERYDKHKFIYDRRIIEVFVIASMRPEKYQHDLRRINTVMRRLGQFD